MTNSDFKAQAETTIRLFFLHVKTEGIILSPFDQKSICSNACRDLKDHVMLHKINQKSIDSFKLYGFLSYHTALVVAAQPTPDSRDLDILCMLSIERMSITMDIETSKRLILEHSEKSYISSMLKAEVLGNAKSGIGANGVGALFAFMVKSYKKCDKFDITTI